MGDRTAIEWADATWNPVRGCTKVSSGCDNCYAMRVAHRFSGLGQPYEGLTRVIGRRGQWNGQIMLVDHALEQPLRWTKPRKVFVNSMSDLFHERVPDDFIDRIFAVMAMSGHHVFQVLTKRPARMRRYLSQRAEMLSEPALALDSEIVMAMRSIATSFGRAPPENAHLQLPRWPLPNVWIGVSVEDQAAADERIPDLLNAPAAVRWISAEPLLGPVDFEFYRSGEITPSDEQPFCERQDLVHWVVAGGESGPGARPMHPQWVREIRDQCRVSGIPFLFKQWGDWLPNDQPAAIGLAPFRGPVHDWAPENNDSGNKSPEPCSFRIGKHKAGRLLDGTAYDEYPYTVSERAPPQILVNGRG